MLTNPLQLYRDGDYSVTGAGGGTVISYFDFEETGLVDQSGYATNPTIVGSTTAMVSTANAKRGSKSFYTTGTGTGSGYLNIGVFPELNPGDGNAYTIEFWMYLVGYPVGSVNGNLFNLVAMGIAGTNPKRFHSLGAFFNTGGIYLRPSLWVSGTTFQTFQSVSTPYLIPFNQWTHIAWCWRPIGNGTTMYLYKNGVMVLNGAFGGTTSSAGLSDFTLGAAALSTAKNLNAYYDAFKVTKGVMRYAPLPGNNTTYNITNMP